MLDGNITDEVEATSLSHNPQHIDIYSSSWGPDDNGATVDGPRTMAKLALKNGALKVTLVYIISYLDSEIRPRFLKKQTT